MSSFTIPRVAIPATLRLTVGEPRRGQIFLMERVPQHSGPETPLEMLNRAEPFFPFRPERNTAGAVLLVAKAHTIAVAVSPEAAAQDPARLSASKRVSLELALADGATLVVWASVELPAHHSRPLDYLNASADPFLAVSTEKDTQLVNRAHVLYARPQE